MKSTKPAQHKLCGLFYVYCRPVRIAENYKLWHPEWDPLRWVQKPRVQMAKDASLFQGPPEKQGELMPDNDNRIVWTLKEYQSYAKKMGLPLWLVCRYENTSKTVELKVPDSANQCKAGLGENSTRFYAFCE
ncbi:STY0301 family protein [Cronobacter sakazakii]|uniref:STY0301 family protein n=1 Tax=Cronobacter sakazakii TaxID=28141 RepID=UPI0029500870|nr:STY0301 family protein [Cronobacter sakazakii]